ncbi:hypothetical protein EII35_13285 [Arachnia propionica]|uniref:Uncharacterized protein n=1 Tax=Arachnia propionica TaxID=1750 RepID=A0A3P1WVH0_9ACTN|nr:hypothetical protein EII35_13285 [Arachnia propionica]
MVMCSASQLGGRTQGEGSGATDQGHRREVGVVEIDNRHLGPQPGCGDDEPSLGHQWGCHSGGLVVAREQQRMGGVVKGVEEQFPIRLGVVTEQDGPPVAVSGADMFNGDVAVARQEVEGNRIPVVVDGPHSIVDPRCALDELAASFVSASRSVLWARSSWRNHSNGAFH